MTSPFAHFEKAISMVVEDVVGERLRFMPMRAGKYSAGGSDPSRGDMVITGIWTEDHGLQRSDGDATGTAHGVQMMAGEIRISVDRSLFGSLSEVPRQSDRFQAMDRDGMPIVEVVYPAPDNASRILLHCVRVKVP